ncbi:MAG: NHLP family bacteriocin export ABC transporter peptidase/permease/ATPase subunit [Oscillospiraceae bacterium]
MSKKNNIIKKPLTKGYAKVPVIMQMEALECGAACLTMILSYYGRWIPLEQIRADCGVSRDGSKAKNILKAARNHGLIAKGYRYDAEELKQKTSYPAIIHWNFNHFVVLCGFKGNKAVINDPARGYCEVTMQEFEMSFTGICMMFEPDESFEPCGKPKSVMEFALKRLKGAGSTIAFVTLTTVIVSVMGILSPAFSRVFLDRLITGRNPDWVTPFFICLSVITILQIVVEFIRDINLLKLNGKMAAVGNTNYMWHILHLPMDFFSQRLAGDIQKRQQDNAQIAENVVNTLVPLVLNAIMMIIYLSVMFSYSPLLAVIGVATVFINIFISRVISNKRINVTRVQMRDSGKLIASTVSGISMIETIKSSGAENGYFERWAGFQSSVNAQDVKFAKLNNLMGAVPQLLTSLASVIVLALGVFLTINGQFTAGMILAFQGFLTAFTQPANEMISAGQVLQEMRTKMERIEDVMEHPEDNHFAPDDVDDENVSYAKLTGNIELKNVTFGYSRLEEPLIKDFSMTIKPGQRIAFVGSSGCGKSTLSKLISGLYQPRSGEILYDGKKINEINRSVFTGSLGVVDQDITIFEDTIENNIKMWDDSIEDFEVIMAARDAQIHNDIVQRDGGYKHKLTEGGRNLSGGQRQRLEIARVLAQDPTIIILDEATSALDAKTEYNVVKSIQDRGITCIVVAHRLSTIRDCDEIIVLDHGNVVERGTHDELYAKGGAYTKLVTNE